MNQFVLLARLCKANIRTAALPVGRKPAKIPENISGAYDRMIEQLLTFVKTHSPKDQDELKARTETLAEKAGPVHAYLKKVLLDSSDSHDRFVAAYALGLVAQSRDEVLALVRAARDSSSRSWQATTIQPKS